VLANLQFMNIRLHAPGGSFISTLSTLTLVLCTRDLENKEQVERRRGGKKKETSNIGNLNATLDKIVLHFHY
jgi:hypothetical protein